LIDVIGGSNSEMDNVIDILDKRYYFTEQKKAKLRENISICD
jgi:hypothetical protein